MFPCTICGECCKHVSLAKETQWLDRGDGACLYLDIKANRCIIYNERPLVCRVDGMFDSQYKETMTRTEFYTLNAECCNIMQNKAGLDSRFRIDVTDYFNKYVL